ncbi:cobalt transporter CbiM [Desulfolutivibrio sulfoxidireducens]|uniref:cobalt transporter CbiM n=1 Tax=Desulfolutivibrio sulfoxidireducens TaxID=2773299 RepID=UPI00159DC85A|nr:cobalt transporter CbiM [Desulfolutivibrio sulfoxidireducens]QLA16161.1 cobalt transporter CbiM [Desulfolutivibrio sulfoxidireducens]QLA19941.1 cobalt transporter CbiM [Desulfolutivibrio sulfoxidireducens]
MHISEGVLSAPVLGVGAALAAVGTFVGLRRLDYDRLMTVAILSAAFFVASLIHIPIGPSSVHLIMNGLLGAVLGWAAFPAILTGLLLQAVLFQYGGLAVLGVNTCDMAYPAVACSYLFRPLLRSDGKRRAVGAFLCGFCSVLFSALLTAVALEFSDEGFFAAARILVAVHLPIMAAEGLITAMVVAYLAKIRPELLRNDVAG